MMGLSLPHLIVLALVVLLLFGRGKVSDLMGDFGKGIKSFKEGINDETTSRPVVPPAQLTAQTLVQPGAPPAAQPYAQPAMTPATPHPEVLPHGQTPVPPVQPGVQPAAGGQVQPMLNGEPLVDQQPR